jgi:hypothetical protein
VRCADKKYTIFAPNDKAFDTLIKSLGGDPETFLDNPPPFLCGVLKFHVVPGIYKTNKLTNDLQLDTLQARSPHTPHTPILPDGLYTLLVENNVLIDEQGHWGLRERASYLPPI